LPKFSEIVLGFPKLRSAFYAEPARFPAPLRRVATDRIARARRLIVGKSATSSRAARCQQA
jgi:hypothetical protein